MRGEIQRACTDQGLFSCLPVLFRFRIRSQQALPSWALYEVAEELTAAFSRLEPSMQPVLLIHYKDKAHTVPGPQV